MRRVIFILFWAFLVMSLPISAQVRLIGREKLDSVSNPALSAISSALEFDRLMIMADPLREDDMPVSYEYTFRNVSDEDFTVAKITTTCSCVTAETESRLVKAGESSKITVTYNPKGHPGRFERKVFIYSGKDSRPAAILRLMVDVSVGDDLSGLYPMDMGRIRLRSNTVKVLSGQRSVERLKFLNVSDSPLTLKCEENMLPDCLGFRTEPETVMPSEEGEIVLSFDPKQYSAGRMQPKLMVMLKGTGLTPGRSTIIVTIEK